MTGPMQPSPAPVPDSPAGARAATTARCLPPPLSRLPIPACCSTSCLSWAASVRHPITKSRDTVLPGRTVAEAQRRHGQQLRAVDHFGDRHVLVDGMGNADVAGAEADGRGVAQAGEGRAIVPVVE